MDAISLKNSRMKKDILLGALILMSLCLTACHSGAKDEGTDLSGSPVEEPVPVVQREKPQDDGRFIGIGKGTIEANRIVPVYSRLDLLVKESKVKEGTFVREGDLLFTLDGEEQENRIRQLAASLREKELALRDILIGQGFSWEDTLKVPRKKMELARVKSGYNATLVEYEIALKEMRKTSILAPASGFIYQLKVYPNDFARTSEPCCSIVNTDRLNVVFYILEREIGKVKEGSRVSVIPQAFEDRTYEAKIIHILPMVDSNGMIQVKARLEDPKDLWPGMNVFVNI